MAIRRFLVKKRRIPESFNVALIAFITVLISFAWPVTGMAIVPDQLVIVVNKRVPESLRLARYYMKERNIPHQNIIQVDTTQKEQVEREEYEKHIAAPVRSFLTENDPEGNKFKCIILMYGIPLRIGPPKLSLTEQSLVLKLRVEITELKEKINISDAKDKQGIKKLKEKLSSTEKELRQAAKTSYVASVDSEIALVMEKEYPLEGWLPNRYFVGFIGKEIANMPKKVIPVSRLDGPSEDIVYRIINDSIETEKTGLTGKAYFDARWPDKGVKNLSAYQIYDRLIHNAAYRVESSKKMPVVLDEKEKLFQPGEAPDAALYCGWYSLGKYIDAFTWVKGAVGFHVASSECTTLKSKTSEVWCKVMLEKGVAATLGPVAEPYLQAFPYPDVFFGCLLDGQSLIECYTASIPFWSWQMILIGDPLYRPFKHR
ncbi:MAG: TIGR03790 family protein [Proteobacteria bacterium]|nr:TIGR03790 family protein [Pseudomonadota bacterium]